jgi:hypothetical protein
VPPTGTAPPAGTGPPGVGRRFARWTCLAVAVITLPAGGYGAATQHSAVPLLLIIGDDGRCLLPVSGAGVAGAALYAFAAATGAPAAVRYDPLGPATLRGEYPGSVSWYWAHQILTGILISAAVVAVVTAAVLVTQV